MCLRMVSGGRAALKMALLREAFLERLTCNGNHTTSNQKVANTGIPSLMNRGDDMGNDDWWMDDDDRGEDC